MSMLRTTLTTLDGGLLHDTQGIVETCGMSLSQLQDLYAAVLNPSFATSLNLNFADISGLLISVIKYPFRLPVSSTRRKLIIFGRDIEVTTDKYVSGYGLSGGDALALNSLGGFNIEPLGDEIHYYDLNGYTRIEVYLPYYGKVELQPNDVMGKRINISYAVSYSTGELLYFITTGSEANEIIISKHSCQVGLDLPISSTNRNEINRNMALAAVNTLGNVASAALSIGMTAAGVPVSTISATGSVVKTVKERSPKTGRMINAQKTTTTATRESNKVPNTLRHAVSEISGVASSTVNAINNVHLSTASENVKNSVLEQFGPEVVKVIIYRPKLINPVYTSYVGRPFVEARNLGEVAGGFVKCSDIHFDGDITIEPTYSELQEMRELVMSGIII